MSQQNECRKCKKGGKVYPHGKRERKLWTTDGRITESQVIVRCNKCGSSDTPISPIAPKGSRYAWDIIDQVIALRECGATFGNIVTNLSVDYGVKTSLSSVFDLYHKYKGDNIER